jgi:hypothetical protein
MTIKYFTILFVIFVLCFHTIYGAESAEIKVTSYLPTEAGFFVNLVAKVICPNKCKELTKYSFAATTSTSTSYGYSTAFVSLRYPDSSIHFISNSKGSAFPKDRTNTITLIDSAVTPGTQVVLTPELDTIIVQSTFYVLASSVSLVSRLKTAQLTIRFVQSNDEILSIDETITFTPPLNADLNAYNNTIAVKHPIMNESFQFQIDTLQNPLDTSLYTKIPTTVADASVTTNRPIQTDALPPSFTQFSLISPTEFSFVPITIPDMTFPTTLQRANCFFNNYPVNATISADGSTLTFSPVFNDIIGQIMRRSPIISCRDIHIQNKQASQFKFTSLIFSTVVTTQSLETSIVDGKIQVIAIPTSETTLVAYPITFFSGVIPQLAVGTTFYQPLDVQHLTEAQKKYTKPAEVTSGTGDLYIWDFEYPFPSAEPADEVFNLIQEHQFTSQAFHTFDEANLNKKTSLSAKNILKVINPYTIMNDPEVKLPDDIPHLYNSPTINITRTPAWDQPQRQGYFSPYMDIWNKKLDNYYAPHFSIAFTNFVSGVSTPNSAIQTMNLTLPLIPLITGSRKIVTISYRAAPSLFSAGLLPILERNTPTFSDPDKQIQFEISGSWFAPKTTFTMAKITSRLGKTYFSGDFSGCTARLVANHSTIPISVVVPVETYEIPIDNDDDHEIDQYEIKTSSQLNNSLDVDEITETITFINNFRPQADSSDIRHIKRTDTFYIYFDKPVVGDVGVFCFDAHRIVNTVHHPVSSSPFAILQTPAPTVQPQAKYALHALDLDLITIGTNHYGSVQDVSIFSGDFFTALWAPNYSSAPDPSKPDPVDPVDPVGPKKEGLSAGVIVIIVLAAIVGGVLMAIGGYYGFLWGREQYIAYQAEQAKYQEQQDAFEATKIDVVQITKTANNKKKKTKR